MLNCNNKLCHIKDKAVCSFSSDTLPVVLHITDRCNESCTFCWHKSRANMHATDMTEAVVQDILKHLAATEAKALSLTFMGGEPTLLADIICSAMHRAAAISAVKGNLVTNGLLMPTKILELPKYFNFAFMVSLPSEGEGQDKGLLHRRLENIKRYTAMASDTTVYFLLTVPYEDTYRLSDIVLKWKRFGIHCINIAMEYQDTPPEGFNSGEYYATLVVQLLKAFYLSDDGFIVLNIDGSRNADTGQAGALAYFSDGSVYANSRAKFFNKPSFGSIYTEVHPRKNIPKECTSCSQQGLCKADTSGDMVVQCVQQRALIFAREIYKKKRGATIEEK